MRAVQYVTDEAPGDPGGATVTGTPLLALPSLASCCSVRKCCDGSNNTLVWTYSATEKWHRFYDVYVSGILQDPHVRYSTVRQGESDRCTNQ